MKTEVLRFWAKTTHDRLNHENAFHPLVCHLIDVATAALMLWNEVLPDVTKKRLAAPFGFGAKDSDKAGNLIAFLVGLHDLGKCSPPFALRGEYDKIQRKNKQTVKLLELYRNTDCFCDEFKPASEAPHNFVTALILPPILHDNFGFPKNLAANVAEIVGGHHGTFPDSNFLNKGKSEAFCGGENWRAAQAELTATLAELFGIERLSHFPDDKKLDNAMAMIFAGLTTVADWVGSNTDFFKCEIEDWRAVLDENYEWFDPKDYFNRSKRQAAEALETLGWTNWVRESNEKSFDELFSHLKNKHRDLQDAAIEIAGEREFDSPGICVVESPMGEGKTEAAMFLADAWNARLGTRGVYFALPTQATSNQMFSRVREFLRARFADRDAEFVHLLLQHGHSSISAEFAENIREFRSLQNISDDAEKDRKNFSNVVAAEWFTYKKRGLLAPFGVGTIDQILLAVLQTKHVFVRLFGLAHKTVIIDEVHAYDAYMSALLERLLEWLAALRSPVILLSATLPRSKRDALVKAYLKGLGQKFDGGDLANAGEADKYPRISYATAAMPDKTFKVRGLETSVQNTKTLYLEWKSEDDFVEELKSKLAGGGCAAIVCNTVDRAQTLYAKLAGDEFFAGKASDGEPKLDLLHARFRFKDRERREQRILKRFGKPDETGASPHRPRTAVLIATQIIEQSLDLDFDLMISELAPADLLLQRAGRLQRHKRDRHAEFKEKTALWLIKPPLNADGGLIAAGNSPDFGKSGIVYDKHILLRSWLKLRPKIEEAVEIKIPDGVERLIEDVYDQKLECFDDEYLNLWEETKYALEEKLREKRIKAKAVYLTDFDDEDFYNSFNFQLDEDDPEKHQTLRAHTRDEERPSVSIVILTQREADSIDFDTEPSRETSEFLIKREVKISRGGLTQEILTNPDFKKSSWEKSSLLRHHRLIVLDEHNRKVIGKTVLILDDEKGIEYQSVGGKSE